MKKFALCMTAVLSVCAAQAQVKWDLPTGYGAEGVEKKAEAFRTRFEEALTTEEPLTALERRARGGIVARQVTLR